MLTRLLTVRSPLRSGPLAQGTIDPHAVLELSGVGRLGNFGQLDVLDLPLLARLARSTPQAHTDADLLGLGDLGLELGLALDHAIEWGTRLWVAEVRQDDLSRLHELFGKVNVHVVGTAGGGQARDTVVVAVSPTALVHWLSANGATHFLRAALDGTETQRCSRRTLAALREAGVQPRERSLLRRAAMNPKVIAYAAVFLYSSLRALPVSFVPNFHGNIWVLWSIDLVTAVPYTWGILEAVAGRTIARRLLGLVVTVATFVAPYVYFWTKGREYPHGVVAGVIAMIVAAITVEIIRYLRDRALARILRTPAGRGDG